MLLVSQPPCRGSESCLEKIGCAKDTGRSWTLGNAEYAVDILKGVFIKGPVYEGSGF
jgi:hypothetical protein